MKKSIRVFASATVANVVCGFDVMGFAVEKPGDEVMLEIKDKPGVEIKSVTGDQGKLPLDPEKNTVSVAVKTLLKAMDYKMGIAITLHKNMPFSSGLGSSAASAVAGVFAINQLLSEPFTKKELLPFAMEAERVACGSAIADNVAASMLGGFVLIRNYDPLDVIEIATPEDLYCTIIHPKIEIKTKDARDILKKQVLLKDAVKQWGNVGGLIAGLMQSDYELIGRSMQDVIIEPMRSLLIPGFDEIKKAALDSGVLGAGISGSGPSLFALSKGIAPAQEASHRMKTVFDEFDIESDVYVSKVNRQGPVVLE